MELLDYICALAQQGETALITRQKLTLDDNGYPQYHGDGAPKATWPAFLPSKWKDNDWAWYINTGAFIIDRFENGKPAARKDACEYVLFMVLDDVGTKSLTPPFKPTWIIETSPNNYQWGIVFSEQPTKADYEAAIKAIAAAGYTDPGATNAVRNCRLPGSPNLKQGRDGFKARLVKFNKGVEYTLADICANLSVVPGEADKTTMRTVHLADDGGDDVAAWLDTQGWVLEQPNGSGWMGVICPNADEHTDGNPMGRYNPSSRAYCCYHGHCGDLSSDKFLEWVADQGGPSHEAGIRPELLANAMREAYEKIDKGDMFSEGTDAEAVVAAVEAREIGRIAKQDLLDRFAYIAADDSYFDLTFRREYRRRAFDAIYRHLDTRSTFGKGPRVGASVWFDENRQAKGARVLEGVTYAPGASVLCTEDALIYGNKWVDGRPTVKGGGGAASVKRWLDLMCRLVPEEYEREHLLNVLAYKVQHPEQKINHAVLLIGKPGIGKDSLYAPFLWAIGGTAHKNVHILAPDEIGSQFTYALENEVIVLNELRQPEGKDRRALENTLKPIIAAPPEYLTVNRKGLHPYMALNRVLVLAGSNWDVPINLPSDDRRWFVIKSQVDRMPDADARALWAWYKTGGGFEACAAYMLARDVSAFSPGDRPPMTEAKAVMVEQGMSGSESYLIDLIREQAGEFATGVIAGPWHKLIDRLQGAAPDGVKLHSHALFHALNEAGWRDMGLIKSKEYATKKHAYCAPGLADRDKADIRRIIERKPDGLALVK